MQIANCPLFKLFFAAQRQFFAWVPFVAFAFMEISPGVILTSPKVTYDCVLNDPKKEIHCFSQGNKEAKCYQFNINGHRNGLRPFCWFRFRT